MDEINISNNSYGDADLMWNYTKHLKFCLNDVTIDINTARVLFHCKAMAKWRNEKAEWWSYDYFFSHLHHNNLLYNLSTNKLPISEDRTKF